MGTNHKLLGGTNPAHSKNGKYQPLNTSFRFIFIYLYILMVLLKKKCVLKVEWSVEIVILWEKRTHPERIKLGSLVLGLGVL